MNGLDKAYPTVGMVVTQLQLRTADMRSTISRVCEYVNFRQPLGDENRGAFLVELEGELRRRQKS